MSCSWIGEGCIVDKALELTPRQKTLLMFLGVDGEQGIDPVRVQKGLFIMAMETPKDWLPTEARYRFEPYHYGPYSAEIQYDLDKLEGYGLVEATRVIGRSWNYYSLTPEGAQLSSEVAEATNPKVVEYTQKLRDFVGNLTFRNLLTTVYRNYPDYAVNSVFKQ